MYYSVRKKQGQWEKCPEPTGRRVLKNVFPQLHLFVHRSGKFWVVTDAESGSEVACNLDRGKAIMAAENRIIREGIEEFRRCQKEAINKSGIRITDFG